MALYHIKQEEPIISLISLPQTHPAQEIRHIHGLWGQKLEMFQGYRIGLRQSAKRILKRKSPAEAAKSDLDGTVKASKEAARELERMKGEIATQAATIQSARI